jgi:Cu2+-exporting ATPase
MLLRLGVAALVGMQAMMFAEVNWLDAGGQMPAATRELFRWLTLLLCTPVVFWCGQPILAGMRRELRLAAPGMDTLAGSFDPARLRRERGGERCAAGRRCGSTRRRCSCCSCCWRACSSAMPAIAPASAGAARARATELAWRWRGEVLEQVPVFELQVGDELQVPADDNVPADGMLLDDRRSSTRRCSAASRRRCATRRASRARRQPRLPGRRAPARGRGRRRYAPGALQALVQDAQERGRRWRAAPIARRAPSCC